MKWRSLLYVLKFSLLEMESKCYVEEEIGLFIVLHIQHGIRMEKLRHRKFQPCDYFCSAQESSVPWNI